MYSCTSFSFILFFPENLQHSRNKFQYLFTLLTWWTFLVWWWHDTTKTQTTKIPTKMIWWFPIEKHLSTSLSHSHSLWLWDSCSSLLALDVLWMRILWTKCATTALLVNFPFWRFSVHSFLRFSLSLSRFWTTQLTQLFRSSFMCPCPCRAERTSCKLLSFWNRVRTAEILCTFF